MSKPDPTRLISVDECATIMAALLMEADGVFGPMKPSRQKIVGALKRAGYPANKWNFYPTNEVPGEMHITSTEVAVNTDQARAWSDHLRDDLRKLGVGCTTEKFRCAWGVCVLIHFGNTPRDSKPTTRSKARALFADIDKGAKLRKKLETSFGMTEEQASEHLGEDDPFALKRAGYPSRGSIRIGQCVAFDPNGSIVAAKRADEVIGTCIRQSRRAMTSPDFKRDFPAALAGSALTAFQRRALSLVSKGYGLSAAPRAMVAWKRREMKQLLDAGLVRVSKNHSKDKHGAYATNEGISVEILTP